MRRATAIVTALVSVIGAGISMVPPTSAATLIVVTTGRDELNVDGDCSLREAIVAANTDTGQDDCPAGDGPDRIRLDDRKYELRRDGANEQAAETGDLDTQGHLAIVGRGPGKTAVVGTDALDDRIFEVTGGQLVLRGLQISGGVTQDDTLGDPTPGGGVLKNHGANLLLDHVTVSNNRARGGGAGVWSGATDTAVPPPPDGNTTIVNSKIIDNRGSGDGFVTLLDQKVVVRRSSISSNNGGGFVAVQTRRLVLVRSRTNNNEDDGLVGVELNNLRLSHVRSMGNSNGGAGFIFVEVAHSNLEDLVGSRNDEFGFVSVNSNDLDLENGVFSNNVDQGLIFSEVNGAALNNVRAVNNRSAGLTFSSVTDLEGTRLTANDNRGQGLVAVNAPQAMLRRIRATGNRDQGIVVVNGPQTKLFNTIARNNGETGAQVVSADNTTIRNARMVGNTSESTAGGLVLVSSDNSTLRDLVVAGNSTTSTGGGMTIVSSPMLSMRNLTVRDNRSRNMSGGLELIASDESMLRGMRVNGNVTRGMSGGLSLIANEGLLVRKSTVAGNEAVGARPPTAMLPRGSAGGILSASNEQFIIFESTISGNESAGRGGGIAHLGIGGQELEAIMVNSTISGNRSGGGPDRGGGAYLRNTHVALLNNTITRNHSPRGGGIFADLLPEDPPDGDPTNDPQMIVVGRNTIIAGQRSGGDCRGDGDFDSVGHNLDLAGSCFNAGSDRHANPKLGPLAYNGGPTRTHLLERGSPARDHGANSGCPPRDQRGRPRPRTDANRCDIGSVEMRGGGGGGSSGASLPAGIPGLAFDGDEACVESRLATDRIEDTTKVVETTLDDGLADLVGTLDGLVDLPIEAAGAEAALTEAEEELESAMAFEAPTLC